MCLYMMIYVQYSRSVVPTGLNQKTMCLVRCPLFWGDRRWLCKGIDFSGVSGSVNTITIIHVTVCFKHVHAFLLLLADLKKQPGVRVFISNISFATLRTWLQCQRYAPSLGIKNELCLCMAFPINTYLYILFNYCLTENLQPSHTTVKGINSDYWKASVLSLVTAGGVKKFEEV